MTRRATAARAPGERLPVAGGPGGAPGERAWPDRALLLVPAVALALGVLLRVAFLPRKSLWMDEAWMAYLAQQPLADLLAMLPRTTAPLGLTLATKLCAQVPGLPPEVALRLLPLLAGLATAALVPRLVRALGAGPRAAAIAAALAATMPALVHFSRELKPYALDAFFATAFPLAVLNLLGSTRPGGGAPPGRAAGFLPAALAVAAPLLCYGGLFPVAATIAWAWIVFARGGRSAARLPLAAMTAPFLALAIALGVLLLYPQATNPVLRRLFGVASDPDAPLHLAAAGALKRLFTTAAVHQFPGWPGLALALAAVGAVGWPARGRGALAAIAGGSVLLATAAATGGFYLTNRGRLLLFVAPYLIATVSVGLDRLLALLPRRGAWSGTAGVAAVLLAAGFAASWSLPTLSHYLHPERRTTRRPFLEDSFRDVRGLVEETIRRRRPGEPVLVEHGLQWSVRFYAGERLRDASSSPGRRAGRLDTSLAAWLPTATPRGWVLLAGEAEPGLRSVVAHGGCEVAAEVRFLDAVLWEVACPAARPPGALPAPGPRGEP